MKYFSKLKFSKFIQDIRALKSFGKYFVIVYANVNWITTFIFVRKKTFLRPFCGPFLGIFVAIGRAIFDRKTNFGALYEMTFSTIFGHF